MDNLFVFFDQLCQLDGKWNKECNIGIFEYLAQKILMNIIQDDSDG